MRASGTVQMQITLYLLIDLTANDLMIRKKRDSIFVVLNKEDADSTLYNLDYLGDMY